MVQVRPFAHRIVTAPKHATPLVVDFTRPEAVNAHHLQIAKTKTEFVYCMYVAHLVLVHHAPCISESHAQTCIP